jgi:uncharacterized protein (DUF1501 family)
MNDHLQTRRLFLARGMTLLAAAPTIPTFLDSTVLAMADPADAPLTQQDSGKDGKILVVVQLSGGNDGLSTVIPHGDDAYQNARRSLAFASNDVLKIDNYIGLNPALTGMKDLFDDGRMSIIQGVGYPNPNRSHFRAMDIWHSAEPTKEVVTTGWLGRFFDNTCTGEDPHSGVSISDQLPLSMKGEKIMPLSFERADSYRYRGPDAARYQQLNAGPNGTASAAASEAAPSTQPSAKAPAKPVRPGQKPTIEAYTPDQQTDFLRRTAMDAQVSSDRILKVTGNFQPAGEYPNGEFGQGLRTIAAMIGGGMPTRVYYVSLGGFDTHANQRGRHDQLMTQLSNGIAAFWKDMEAQGNKDRVLMMSFSEFGRRVNTNASNGTDHGAAAPVFLMGPKLKPGVVNKHPSLTDLDAGDLKHSTDFRSIYATVLQDWMGVPSRPILGSQFQTMKLIQKA